jgi:hypothetical protein
MKSRQVRLLYGRSDADDWIGTLSRDCEYFLFTKGQISLIDIISEVSKQIGPFDLALTTWTIGENEIRRLHDLKVSNQIRDLKIVIDRSFQSRCPDPFNALMDCFGYSPIRVLKNHSKVILMKNKTWNIVIRTSMNMNRNMRVEQIDLSDDKELLVPLWGLFDEIFETQAEGDGFKGKLHRGIELRRFGSSLGRPVRSALVN